MQNRINAMPEITKNLIIINVLMFLASWTFPAFFEEHLVLYYVENDRFLPVQLVTAFFMHGDIMHILFNMLVLFFFGSDLERTLGPKKYLFLYLAAGFLSACLYALYQYLMALQLANHLNPEQLAYITKNAPISKKLLTDTLIEYGNIWYGGSLGASGATYGVMFSYAYIYPNRQIHLLIPPIPIKAVYLVLGLSVMEYFNEVSRNPTGIGHFVHLSGAFIALAILAFWRKQGERF